MATHETSLFVTGVVEGFYGQPWTQEDRFELLNWMARWGLNTYLYAPKDDLHQRACWRELYPDVEAEKLRRLLDACRQHRLQFVYAVSPGLDIRYCDESELGHLKKRFEQMRALGCHSFSLLFDDIPERMDSADMEQYGSLAAAQCHVANSIFNWSRHRSRDSRLFFCPTAYCGRVADQKLGGEDYLNTIGRELLPEIDVFWTGPEIVSREITVAHVAKMQSLLRRKPIIWDNLHANDYDGRRFFCGPYAGRPAELRSAVGGLLSNPNNEFPLNFVPLRTLAEFVSSPGPWDARAAYLGAMRAWLPSFATCGQPIDLEDLVLFGDCYYLPHEEGPEAEALFESARDVVTGNPPGPGDSVASFRQRASRLRRFCIRAPDLRERTLFHALSRRIWELREELDLFEHWVEFKSEKARLEAPFSSASHQPGTYRGGMLARLQRLLVQQPDGSFTPAPQNETLNASGKTTVPVATAL